ncbi:hypothetical protein AAE478_010116 [Parahypoxylon ruwenzoriense]
MLPREHALLSYNLATGGYPYYARRPATNKEVFTNFPMMDFSYLKVHLSSFNPLILGSMPWEHASDFFVTESLLRIFDACVELYTKERPIVKEEMEPFFTAVFQREYPELTMPLGPKYISNIVGFYLEAFKEYRIKTPVGAQGLGNMKYKTMKFLARVSEFADMALGPEYDAPCSRPSPASVLTKEMMRFVDQFHKDEVPKEYIDWLLDSIRQQQQ